VPGSCRKKPVQRYPSPNQALKGIVENFLVMTTKPRNPPWHRQTSFLGTVAILLALYIAYLLRPPFEPPYVSRYMPITSTGRAKYTPILLDGRHLYFLELISGYQRLMRVPSLGGDAMLVTTSIDRLQLADVSPNGQELLVGSRLGTQADWPLWKISLTEQMAASRLGGLVGHAGTWSPDGRQIAFGVGHDLSVANSDGSQPRRLVSLPGEARWIRWAPDSSVIRFTLVPPHSRMSSLWEVTRTGKNLRPLLPGWKGRSRECCGNWTQDGAYFVFQSNQQETSHLWALREKGGILRRNDRQPVPLTGGPVSYRGPVPSMDGRVVFAVGDQRRSELLRYDVRSQRFEPYLGGLSVEAVDFSKDGQWVAYVTYPDGVLWRCRADGTQRRRLSPELMRVYLPRWSPDGQQITFRADVPEQPVKVYTVSASGESLTRLLPGDRNEADPGWSPDGKKLVFGRMTLPSEPLPKAIHIYDFETKGVTTLPGSEGLFSPRWSPDGRYIAALSLNSQRVMLFDFRTERWQQLAEINASYPNWSADSQYLYFGVMSENKQSQYRMRIDDKKLERILSMPEALEEAISFALWYGMAPDGSTLVARDLSTQEIYALEWELP
jgi:Tol biopolymer transport system component